MYGAAPSIYKSQIAFLISQFFSIDQDSEINSNYDYKNITDINIVDVTDDKIIFDITVAYPGELFGKNGIRIDALKDFIVLKLGKKININIIENTLWYDVQNTVPM